MRVLDVAVLNSSSGSNGGLPPIPNDTVFNNFNTNIGNLRDNRGYLILPTFIMNESPAVKKDWLERMLVAGSICYPVAIKYFYHKERYPQYVGFDWINDLRGWVQNCAMILGSGFKFLDIILTQGDGSWFDPNSETRRFVDPSSPTYAFRLINNIREACIREGLPDIFKYGVTRVGWEIDPPSAKDTTRILREALGPDYKISLHQPQGYGDPLGNGTEWWHSIEGQMLDFFLYQGVVTFPNEFDEFDQPAWQDNMIQILNRILPTGTPIGSFGVKYRDTHDGDKIKEYTGFAQGPDWFQNAPKRVPFVYFEGPAYFLVNSGPHIGDGGQWTGELTNDNLNYANVFVGNRALQLGFSRLGNSSLKSV